MTNGRSTDHGSSILSRRPFRRRNAKQASTHANAEPTLGGRLREIRALRGLSLRELARQSGLNINTLSSIENERTSPGVGTLQQLAQGLQVPMSDFFQPAQEELEVVYQQEARRSQVSFEHGLVEDLAAGMPRLGAEPLILTLSRRSESGKVTIVHTGREFVYCLSGCVRYLVDGREYVLAAGDSLVFEAYLPHRWINSGTSRSRILLVLCPTDTRDSPKQRHFRPLAAGPG
jgi:transcriptional regulator with XRE-family HTH domain